jgi:sugar lactone lactonase YvrE
VTDVELHLRVQAIVGEAPCWDAARERLIWVDIEGRRVYVHQRGRTAEFATPDRVGVAVPTDGEPLLIAYGMQVGLLSPAEGTIAPLCDPAADPGRVRLNDGGTDPRGVFWAGTAPLDEHDHGIAALYRLRPDGELEHMIGGLGLANGLTWSPDGDFMYVSDTLSRQILRLAYDPASGDLDEPVTLVDTSQLAGAPDGIAVDSDGNLWVAFWDGAAAHCFTPDGRRRTTVKLPVSRPTSCAFAGRDLARLVITTARWGLTAAQLAAQPLAGSILAADLPARGLPSTPAAYCA